MAGEPDPELVKAAMEEFQPGKIKAGDETPPALKQAMMDFMIPAITKGIWEGIFSLPDEAREIVFKAASKRCCDQIDEFAGFDPADYDDVDEFMAAWDKAFGGMMTGKREGDTIVWEFGASEHGGCTAPEVMLGLVEPNPLLCQCSCQMIKRRFEKVTKRPVEVKLLDSYLTNGADKCRYLINLNPD
jgi:hypothetical protein